MASASYSEDLTCAICLTIFTDPVNLLCGHSFCRGCITDALWSQEQCPQCRTAVPTEVKSLPTSYILKSLAEKAKEAEKIKTEPAKEKAEVSELCPEHDEKLKLFCVTDQQLACIICRDGERHEGHKFKPIKEAAASLRRELEGGMENLCGDILAMESLANTQREEIRKTKAKSEQLMTQIHRQFEEMHQFLRKREDEIKNELKLKEQDDVEKMSKSLKVIETALSEHREVEEKLTSVLKIEDSERLLKSWTEGNSRTSAEDLIKPKANDLQVVDSSLSLGPYESHLQFFMWKEMLQVIQPRAELLSLKSNSADIAVSEDGRSLFSTTKGNQASLGSAPAFGSARGSGQTTGLGFGSTTGSGQTAGFGFGSTKGSGQTAGFGFGSSTGLGQTTGFGFGSTTGSGQTAGFGFGSTKGSGQTAGFGFGSSTGSGQTAGFGFGSSTGSGQTTGSTFGSTTGLGQTLNSGKASFDQTTNKSSRPFLFTNHAFSVNEFTLGQHYWEIEVGLRDYWELGIKDHFLKYDGQKYLTCCPNETTDSDSEFNCDSEELVFTDQPRKFGIYLNCASKKLSFYDADNMTHIHTVSELCPEHDEKLKLFCVTDQQLACIICRDGERHEGHKFKPIKEAAASVRRELEGGMENLCGDILAIESLANTQRQEIRKTKAKSEQLMTQIHRQFEEMHQFLRKREDEIKNELKFKEQDDVEKMSKSLKVIETALSERRELEAKVTSVLKIEDSERLLKSWTEGNSRATAEDLIKPKANDLQVVDSSLSLGPYESHLQFFMWKEMLQVIQPRAELLSLKSNSAHIAVSEDGRSLFSTPKSNQVPSRSSSDFCSNTRSRQARASGFGSSGFGQTMTRPLNYGGAMLYAESYEDLPSMSALFTNHAFSVNKFTSGQHYWEVEVGHRDYWELGIKDNFLKYDGQKYSICSPNKTTELGFRDRRRKIGVYLNCALEKLSFYDADNMKHIHTVSSSLISTPLSAYFHIEVTSPDLNPLTVCWY
ncbi:hypothetical protein ABVT39_012221 [Epinephelus coioides]